MARLPRICPPGIPQHVIQRGNNKNVCFADEQDLSAYAAWLKQYSSEFRVYIHAWVFMSNHVHLLATPSNNNALSAMMQALGRRYVRNFNYKYHRSGTLWEGRFKSCLVQSESYLLKCYRYIELNPVRAGMVDNPAEYTWSSYQCNALGMESDICTQHEEYLKLGTTKDDRLAAYRELVKAHIDNQMIVHIRDSVNKGLALGNDRFKDEIESLYKRRLRPAKIGRPKKSRI